MKVSDQSGFAAIEAVLILIIVAMIGGTGYFAWHAKQNTEKTLTNAANSQPGIVKASKVTDFASCKASSGSKLLGTHPEQCVSKDGKTFTDKSQTSTQQYMSIKEWGVRVKVSADTNSLYYYIGSDKPNIAYLSFKTINNIAPNCAADKFSLAAMSRQTQAEHDDALQNPSDTNTAGTVKIGSYWYGYEHSHADCTDGTASMQAAVTKAQPNVDISAIFNTLEATPANQ